MRLGLCLAAFGGSELKTALDYAEELGPLALDLPTDTSLGLVDPRRCVEDAAYLDELAGTLLGRGIDCVSNSRDAQLLLGPHGPHTDPVHPGSVAEKRQHGLTCALGAIRLAERIGASTVRLLPGCPDFARWLSWWGSEVSWRDNILDCREHLAPIVRAARDAGLTLMVEPHPKQVVYDRSSAEALFAENPDWHDVLRLCVDPANLAACGHDPVDAVRSWDGRMAAVHAKDLQRWRGTGVPRGAGWNRYGPQPPIRFRAVGLGELDWPAIVAALQDEGFAGTLYVEHEDALLPRRQSIRLSLDLLRRVVPAHSPEGRTW